MDPVLLFGNHYGTNIPLPIYPNYERLTLTIIRSYPPLGKHALTHPFSVTIRPLQDPTLWPTKLSRPNVLRVQCPIEDIITT